MARRLLRVEAPAVIDNRTQLEAFAEPAGDGVVKCDFDVGVFSSDDLHPFGQAVPTFLSLLKCLLVTSNGRRLRPSRHRRPGCFGQALPAPERDHVGVVLSHQVCYGTE